MKKTRFPARRTVRAALLVSLISAQFVSLSSAYAQVTLNFVNADIDQVAKAIGAATGRTIIVDPRVKGQLNLVAEQTVPEDQALKTMQSALRMQGFALVQDHGVLKVVPEADAKLQGVPTYVGNAPSAHGDQVITQVFRLQSESANNLLPVLRPLISPNNTIAAYPANNTLVVTDYADNVRRIASIIAGIDTAAGSQVAVVPLRNANALDIATILQKLLDPGTIGSTDATLKVNVSADPRTNSIMLRASNGARLQSARQLVAQLDAPTAQPGNIHVVPLRNADAAHLAKVLRGMMGQSSGDDSSSSSGKNGLQLNKSSDSGYGSGSSSSSNAMSALSSGVAPLPTGGGGSGGGLGGTGGTDGSAGGKSNTGSSGDDSASGGMIQADSATNSLIITAPDAVYRNLRNVIDQLDARRAQVYIESLILEVSSDKTGQFGIQWQGGVTSSGGNNILYSGTNFNNATSNGILNLTAAGLAATTTNTGTATALGAIADTTVNNGLNIGLLHRFGSILGIGGLLQAVSGNSDVNVLSTPNLITLDNEEAKIVVGQNVPLISGSYSTATAATTTGVSAFNTYDRHDVGITLDIKPQISQGGLIKMQIYQEDSSVVNGTQNNNGGYTINKRALTSNVLCDDGQIIVLGGLIQDSYTNGNSKVPWLGDLPIIGGLFRTENKERMKTNLMVFLRPVIVRDAETSQRISLDRYDYMRSVAGNYQSDNRVMVEKDVPQPPPATLAPGQGGNASNGVFDWSHMQRPANQLPLAPQPDAQPPYAPDPVAPPPGGAPNALPPGAANQTPASNATTDASAGAGAPPNPGVQVGTAGWNAAASHYQQAGNNASYPAPVPAPSQARANPPATAGFVPGGQDAN